MGMRINTKAKRAQAVLCRPDEDPYCARILEWFAKFTKPDQPISRLRTVPQYGALFAGASARAGMTQRWRPHDACAGWATRAWLSGLQFTEIMELGRWLSDRSLRIYIGTVAQASIEQDPELRSYILHGEKLEAIFFDVWTSLPLV